MSDFTEAMTLQSDNQQPWLPLPTESAQDYYDFRLWLGMSPRPKVVYAVATRNSWENRALAWDASQLPTSPRDQNARQQEDSEILQILKYTLKGQAVKLFSQLERSTSPSMALENLAKCTDVVVKLERLIHGQSTENISQHTTVDYSGLSTEELLELDRIENKLTGKV